MLCPHVSLLAASLRPPGPTTFVHKHECTQCFDTSESEGGIDVCLSCFNGGCTDSEKHHARTHAVRRGHPLVANVVRRRRSKPKRDSSEPPVKKLAITEEREEDLYSTESNLRCYGEGCGGRILDDDDEAYPQLRPVLDGVTRSLSTAQMSEVRAWEEEIEICPHALCLEQDDSQASSARVGPGCGRCDLKTNLWLCLTCGNVGCGRQQFGGTGGNGHGLLHYQETGHAVNVKLGTITAEGSADVYCYDCNDAKLDPHLQDHLRHLGIQVADQQKTEKSMTELQIEHNLKYDFAMTGDDGHDVEPLCGPGLTGLANLGNSCYINSVTQVLFSMPSFRGRFLPPFASHPDVCDVADSASCWECQMTKLAHGLLSGRYSKPASVQEDKFQEGIKPSMIKSLVGKGHPEFSTMRQQDADEFLRHLLKQLRQKTRLGGSVEDPSGPLEFVMEQRLQCTSCRGVRLTRETQDVLSLPVPVAPPVDAGGPSKYADVSLERCLDVMAEPEEVEYQCPSCRKKTSATITSKFATFPRFLMVHARRFQLANWVPVKLEVPIIIPEPLVLDRYLGPGKEQGDVELPDEGQPPARTAAPQVDASALATLESMGFSSVRARKGLLATGNSDAEAAMMWILEHEGDPDIDADESSRSTVPISAEAMTTMVDMGFTMAQAQRALAETNGNPERAIEWLFNHPDVIDEPASGGASAPLEPAPLPGDATRPAQYALKAFVSHKGPSVHSGHYVAHVQGVAGHPGWVLFNDEKVVKADGGAQSAAKLAPFAYLYLLERLEA